MVTESILPPVTSRSSKRPLILSAPTSLDDQTFTAFLQDEVGTTRPIFVAKAQGSWSVKDLVWKHDPSGRARTQQSPLWGLADVYVLDESNDVFVRCKVCALDGVETYLILHRGQTSNGTERFEETGKGKGSPARRGDHLLAALYLTKNLKGGPRTRLTAADGAITKFMRPADRREHHVRFVLMQIMTSFFARFATNAYVRFFLAGFRINCAPQAFCPVTLHLSGMASFISSILFDLSRAAASDYMAVPWAHVCIEMWTAPGSRASYGALILRFTDLGTLDIKKSPSVFGPVLGSTTTRPLSSGRMKCLDESESQKVTLPRLQLIRGRTSARPRRS